MVAALEELKDQLSLLFRDENERTLQKARAPRRREKLRTVRLDHKSTDRVDIKPCASSPESDVMLAPVTCNVLRNTISDSIEDQGINFFFSNYAVAMGNSLDGQKNAMTTWKDMSEDKSLLYPVLSVGLAGLSNVHHDLNLMHASRKYYAETLKYVIRKVRDTSTPDLQTSLKASLILTLYEIVTCGEPNSHSAWGVHMEGAASLLRLITERMEQPSVRTQILFCFSLFVKCFQEHRAAPSAYVEWTRKICISQSIEDMPASDLVMIMMRFINLNASIKAGLIDSETALSLLLALEAELERWDEELFPSSNISIVNTEEEMEYHYQGQYLYYRDLGSARLYSNYRWARILVNEQILRDSTSVASHSPDHALQQKKSIKVISRLAAEICIDASGQLSRHCNPQVLYDFPPPIGNVFVLLFPLVVAGGTIPAAIPDELHLWVLGTLDKILRNMGVMQALRLKEVVKRPGSAVENTNHLVDATSGNLEGKFSDIFWRARDMTEWLRSTHKAALGIPLGAYASLTNEIRRSEFYTIFCMQTPAENATARAAAVKSAFQFAFDGYITYAYGHDELHPISNSSSDSRNGWGASAVDALSTAIIMKDSDRVNIILEYIATIDFNHALSTDDGISLFETTIRYLGGMLAGYDFLNKDNGPLASLVSDSNLDNVDTLLAQSIILADNLAVAFNTPTGIPNNNLYFDPPRTDGSTTNGLATIGTLVLEWTRLSDLTGNTTYATLSQKGESYLLNPQSAEGVSGEPFPGLLGTTVDLNTGLFQDGTGGWVGGDDSYYEYLIKMYVYDSDKYASYKDHWVAAADSSIENLASNPSTRPDLTFLAAYDGTERLFVSEHLACFDGGSFILGGLVLNEQKYIDFGLKLVEGCEDTYASTVTGIGPEEFRPFHPYRLKSSESDSPQWVESSTSINDTNNPHAPATDAAFYAQYGFYITNSAYILRPEVVESFYYAYRATGHEKYRTYAWNAFQAISTTCRASSGFAELNDVNSAGGGSQNDFQDSFLFAEVMKYSFLIHAPDDVWQVENNGVNQFVFNTEAHPLRVAGTPV
ncbi:hypothetical protein B7494_g1391 [Chlorociboria aeruginascens]|nr:hypothetical protein B7494_g1391 [Chlorociboria aeruginascens]